MISGLEKITALGVYLQDQRIGIINRLAGDRHIFALNKTRSTTRIGRP